MFICFVLIGPLTRLFYQQVSSDIFVILAIRNYYFRQLKVIELRKSSRHSVCFLSLSFVFNAANNSMQITADVIGRFSMLKFGACPNLSPHPLIAQWSLKTSFIRISNCFIRNITGSLRPLSSSIIKSVRDIQIQSGLQCRGNSNDYKQ